MGWRRDRIMTEDSVWYRKIGPFRQFFRDIADSSTTVAEALGGWKERSYIPKTLKTMTVQELLNNPKQIEELYYAMKRMQPERHFKFPYNKKEREQELIDLLASDYNIMTDKAHAKVVSGHYNDGSTAFTYGLEAAMAPFNDHDDMKAGEVDFIGNINSGMHLDSGESFFSGGHFSWSNKRGIRLTASSVRGILHECGFSTNLDMTKRRFHSVLYLNLLTKVPDWSGGAGKTSIDLAPYTNLIANTVSSLAYKMPSYHGHGYGATVEYYNVKDENQIAQNYYLNFLRKRYRAIQANPSLKTTDPLTQSGVWYRVHKEMVEKHFTPRKNWGVTRESLTNNISKFCEWLSENEWHKTVTREDLGITASSRAIMYFDGHEYPVSADNISVLANAKTTDIIVIEKEGMADVLKKFTDEYHIALVFTRGRFVQYVKELIEAAISKKINIKVWTLTDYDVDGMEIANAVDKTKVPRIGINLNTIEWLQENGYPDLTFADVEEEHYAKDAKIRTNDQYLWSKRIELDSVHAEVGGEGLWSYIIYQIKTLAKEGRNYAKVIEKPPLSHLYPKVVSELLDYFSNYFDGLINEEYAKIEKTMVDVRGRIWKIENKKALIRKQLKDGILNKDKNAEVKTIIEKVQNILNSGDLPKPKDGYVSEETKKWQKEESEREELEKDAEDEDEWVEGTDDNDKGADNNNITPTTTTADINIEQNYQADVDTSTNLDIRDVEGVGPTTARKFKEVGIVSVIDLAAADVDELALDINSSKETAEMFIKAANKLLEDTKRQQAEDGDVTQ
jgi:predicted flap endonuclease-1-like 5' DNA nuclease